MKKTKLFGEASRLYDLGFAILWLHPKSKRPIDSGWTTGPRTPWSRLENTYTPGLNVGVRLGTPSKLPHGFLCVVDVDVKSTEPRHEEEALSAARKLLKGKKLPIVLSGRGNGSRHYYCVTEKPFKGFDAASSSEFVRAYMPSVKKPSKKDLAELSASEINEGYRMRPAWEISIMSEGRQVVLPPSIHPDSNQPYEWKRGFLSADSIPLMTFEIPHEEEDAAGAAPNAPEKAPAFSWQLKPVEIAWLDLPEKIKKGIVSGEGVTDRSAYLLPAAKALFNAGLDRDEVLTVLTEPDTFLGECAYEHAQTKSRGAAARWLWRYSVKKVWQESEPSQVFANVTGEEEATLSEEAAKAQAEDFDEERPWTQELQKTQHGGAKLTVRNLDLIFSNLVGKEIFVRDVFAGRDSYGIDTPWGGEKGHSLTDVDLVLMKRWLSDTVYQIEPPTSLILETAMAVAFRNRVHPVREWLSGLKWDGTPRLATWIKRHLKGKAPEPFLSEVSQTFLIAMVKRVFEPGCQWDYVLILEGGQGKYKSSTARALAGDGWFMDNLPDLRDKDAMLNLQGKWLVELGELAGVKRSDFNLVKDYLSRRCDSVRSPYGRLREDIPRQSVFIGTVNEGQYLKDPTGNRRFWPVRVGTCDVEGLKAEREQLFAEAMALYRTENPVLKLSEEAEAQAKELQNEKRIDDDETMMREFFLDFAEEQFRLPEEERFDFNRFKMKDLFVGPKAPWIMWSGRNYAYQVGGHVLSEMGFIKRKIEGQRIWRGGLKLIEKILKESELETDDFL